MVSTCSHVSVCSKSPAVGWEPTPRFDGGVERDLATLEEAIAKAVQ